MAARVLVSGFEPFEGVPWNPSGPLALYLAERAAVETRAIVLPVVFNEAARLLFEIMESFQPTHVLALGVGAHPTEVRVERFAVNLADTGGRGDNRGRKPRDETLVTDGPTGYFATLPIRELVDHLRTCGLDARASTGAGTFVCNDLFYRTMHLCTTLPEPPLAGFVHLPYVQGMTQATPASPTLETLADALRTAIEKLLV